MILKVEFVKGLTSLSFVASALADRLRGRSMKIRELRLKEGKKLVFCCFLMSCEMELRGKAENFELEVSMKSNRCL